MSEKHMHRSKDVKTIFRLFIYNLPKDYFILCLINCEEDINLKIIQLILSVFITYKRALLVFLSCTDEHMNQSPSTHIIKFSDGTENTRFTDSRF